MAGFFLSCGSYTVHLSGSFNNQKKVRQMNTYENDEVIVHLPDSDQSKTQSERKLEELLESFSGTPNATVSLYRQNGSSLNDGLSFLDSFPPDKYNREQIFKLLRDSYGSGDYRLQLRVGGRIRVNDLISIEEPKNNKQPQQSETGLYGALMQRMDKMQEMILRVAQTPQRSESEYEMKMLEKMQAYKKLFSDGSVGGGGSGMNELLNSIKSLSEIGFISIPTNKKQDSDSFGDFLGSMAPVLQTLLENTARQQGIQQAPLQNPLQSRPSQTPNQQQLNELNTVLKSGITFLVQGARMNADPETYADWCLDVLPEVHHVELLNRLVKPEWFETISAISYVGYQYKPWFDLVRDAIIKQFNEPADEITGNDPERVTGNDSDTQKDEETKPGL